MMEQVKINLITRFSREESIKNCLNSLYTQSYDNYHQYITYEDFKDLEFLKSIIDENKTTLVKVPHYTRLKNLWMYYQYHDVYTNYLDKNWYNDSKFKVHFGEKPKLSDLDNIENEKVEEVFRYEKNGFWCTTIDRTVTNLCQHFPFNLYNKIVEAKIEDGWIMYLDDDDVLYENDSLEKLSMNINKTDEDTLQIFTFKNRYDNVKPFIPQEKYLRFMKAGHPIIHMECIAGNLCFHSKYKDYTVWDEWRKGDVRTIKALEKVTKNVNYIDEIIMSAGYREKVYQ